MERRVCEDVPGGATVVYDIADPSTGYRQCTFTHTVKVHQNIFNSLPYFPCREDDVFIVSYPKTGTNWLWEMVLLAMTDSTEVTGRSKGEGMIEASPVDRFEQLKSPRLLNHHLIPKYQPTDILKKPLRTILLLRNPKDVAVSFYNHTKGIGPYEYDGKFENYLQMFMRGEVDCGSYPDYLRQWQQFIHENKHHPIITVYYEDLKQDSLTELKKICKFLEIDVDEQRLSQICDGCRIDKMKKAKIEQLPLEVRKSYEILMKNGFTIFRKGQVGDWRHWFTLAQSEMFDFWWKQHTLDIDLFNFRYTI